MTHTRTSNVNTNITPMPSRNGQQLAELLDKATLCERLNISPRTIENMVKDGSLSCPTNFVFQRSRRTIDATTGRMT